MFKSQSRAGVNSRKSDISEMNSMAMSYKQNQLNDLNKFLQLDEIDEEERA
jgi:hypothetical protein